MNQNIIILGAGPAGLSCAYELGRHDVPSTVFEGHGRVGGLCRTIPYKGFLFDVGPHRFFTKNDEVDQLWHDILCDQSVTVNRRTRILYRHTLFEYPLKPLAALRGLGLATSLHAMISFGRAKMTWRSQYATDSFEDWVVGKFGKVLYDIFFKTYTEKVWGISCRTISAEWAGQRIKGLSLGRALLHALKGPRNRSKQIKSLVDTFDYPKRGAGQAYEELAYRAAQQGATFKMNTRATRILHDSGRVRAVESSTGEGHTERHPVDHLFSSIPLTQFVLRLDPSPPEEVLEAARCLYYRNHITVNLIINRRAPFPDHWIYVHDPSVRMARLACYGNFSEHMLGSPQKDALAVEYFTFSHDDLWFMSDAELIRLAGQELEQVGLIQKSWVEDGFVVRERDSYPMYYLGYRENLDCIRYYLDQFANITLIGRGGMYRYNNQDHAILSGLLAARNYCANDTQYDLWEINEENEYLEEKQLPSPLHADNPRNE